MKRFLLILFGWLLCISALAALPETMSRSAGTDFYFTIFDHWLQDHNYTVDVKSGDYSYYVCITAVEETDVHIFTVKQTLARQHLDANERHIVNLLGRVDPLEVVRVTSTMPCYVNVEVQGIANGNGNAGGAASAILPTHLLGKHYMLQGWPGMEYTDNGSTVKTYSLFSIVGTQNGTRFTVTPKTELICEENGEIFSTPTTFDVWENQTILFHPTGYNLNILGSIVQSDKPVAVFQGNEMTRIPMYTQYADYTWEQARPTGNWGTEFIFAKSANLKEINYVITALEDNTQLLFHGSGGNKFTNVYLQSGQSLALRSDASFPTNLQMYYLKADKPVCCYLYTTGGTVNDNVGDPSMVEIAPLDRPATDARWAFPILHENTLFHSLIVTTKEDNEKHVFLDNKPLTYYISQSGTNREVMDGYVTYEISQYINHGGNLIAEEGGFSAYVLEVQKVNELHAFNISLSSNPLVTISVPRVCEGDPAILKGEFNNDGTIKEPVTYQWYFSSDHNNWTPIVGANSLEWTTAPTDPSYEGWYRLVVTGSDVDSPYNTAISNTEQMIVENCDPPHSDLCPDGVLLFREDFGGNDPNDPVAGIDPVPGMSEKYRQIYDTASCMTPEDLVKGCQGMGRGKYLLTKKGYRNASSSYNWSQWFIMDDHTYPNDFTRGYFLEIDGSGDGETFYKTTLNNLCEGTKLTFTAYIANISTPTSYLSQSKNYSYAYPRLSFILTSPETGEELARYNTDTIGHDWRFYGQSGEWRNSAHWQLVGMSFVVPTGVQSVELKIVDYAKGGIGDDFALDDIEVHACFPPVQIEADSVICKDERNRFDLNVDFKNNQTFAEPIVYQWFYTADTTKGWTEIEGISEAVYTPHFTELKTGWYQVVISGAGKTASKTCSAWSDPFHLRVDSNCVDLCDEGVILLHEDIGNNLPSFTTTLDGLCAGADLTFVAHIENGEMPDEYKSHAWLTVYPRLVFTLMDPATQNVLLTYDTGNIPYNSGPREYGKKWTVPEGLESVTLQVANSTPNNAGIDFHIEDIEIRHCMPPLTITGPKEACRKQPQLFRLSFANDGSVPAPEYQWSFSTDSINWTEIQAGEDMTLNIPVTHKSHEGLYRVAVASNGQFDHINCRAFSEPVRLRTKFCGEPIVQDVDTTVCDTLMPVSWRNFEWQQGGTNKDTLRDIIDDDDSLYVHYHLHTARCCPDIFTIPRDTAICDTLLPFTWLRDGHSLLFARPETQQVAYPHTKWTQCDGTVYQYQVDTFHCERLYPFIVNKYNWQLLLDYVTFRLFFPENKAIAFQWYKDEEAIPGAIEDDYSEQNELQGAYQLRVQLDDLQYKWSRILDIEPSPEPRPVTVRIYNSQGMSVREDQMTRGVYLLIYQQGDNTWTEKRIVQ